MFGAALPFPEGSPDHLWFYYTNNNRTFMLDGQGVTAEVGKSECFKFSDHFINWFLFWLVDTFTVYVLYITVNKHKLSLM